MTEDEVVRLFKAASTIGYRFEIPLPGDDSAVPLAGPKRDLDVRLSDTEHVIHELAHCALLGVRFEPDPENLLIRLRDELGKYPRHIQQINEIETFSVTIEVLRQLGVEVQVDEFIVALVDFQLDDFVVSREFDVEGYALRFHTTARGRAAVRRIRSMFKEQGV